MEYDNHTILTVEQIKKQITIFLNNDNYYPIKKIILFGSYANGTAEVNSDIDLLICNSPNFGGMKNFALISELKDLFFKEIEVFIDRNIDKNSSFYHNIQKEGVTIYEQ